MIGGPVLARGLPTEKLGRRVFGPATHTVLQRLENMQNSKVYFTLLGKTTKIFFLSTAIVDLHGR